jgi:hypothetical protein
MISIRRDCCGRPSTGGSRVYAGETQRRFAVSLGNAIDHWLLGGEIGPAARKLVALPRRPFEQNEAMSTAEVVGADAAKG